MYKAEIRKLEDKYALLALEHESALKSIESFDLIKIKLDKYDHLDLKQLITNELINIRALKDTYESHIVARHSSSISELKKLALDYKEMTFYFRKLDSLLGMTFDVSEAQTEVFKVVEGSLIDFKTSIKRLLSAANKHRTNIMEHIVNNLLNLP